MLVDSILNKRWKSKQQNRENRGDAESRKTFHKVTVVTLR